MKRCHYSECRKVLKLKPGEQHSKFLRRKYCDSQCYGNARSTGGQRGKRGAGKVKAKCPVCSILHETPLNWQGRGIPRIYCIECKRIVRNRDYDPAGTGYKARFREVGWV